jgi:4-amino-4-deoxy-L-arabinose transferase-like glycosyltransferase
MSGIAAGLAIMSKSAFGLMPIICFVLLEIFKNKKLHFKLNWNFLYFLIPLLVIILPWHIFQIQINGYSFIDTYFLYHNLKRAVSPLENHGGSLFYYFTLILNPLLFPGFIICATSIFLYFKKKINTQLPKFILTFCLLNMVLYLLIISAIQTKLSWYVLYIYPFTALFCGGGVYILMQQKRASPKRCS